MKERLKYRKTSLNRAKELQAIMRDVAYRTERITGDVYELENQSSQVESLPEEDRAPVVKNIYVQMLELMENLEVLAKAENTKTNISSLSHSKTFSKKSEKALKMDVIDLAIEEDNEAIKQQIDILDRKNAAIKKMRVTAQKNIHAIEKKLTYIEDEIPEDHQPPVEDLNQLDMNEEATLTNQR